LAVDSAQEDSVAQTRSFTSMAVLVTRFAHQLAPQGGASILETLPSICQRLLDTYQPLARQIGEDRNIERFFFLGTDVLYGIACEAMLKLKEMSLSYSEAFHTLELRHGPISMVDKHSLGIGLLSDSAASSETEVLRDLRARGAKTLALGETPSFNGDFHITLATQLPEAARPVTYLPVLQLMAYYRAMINGQDPDKPMNLNAVVTLGRLRN